MKAVFVFVLVIVFTAAMQPGFAQEETRLHLTPDNAGQLVEIARLGRGSTDHVAFSADGQILAVAGTVGVWLYSASDLATPTEPPLLDTQGIALAFAVSPDGSTLAVTTRAGLQMWDVASQTLLSTTPLKRTCEALAFNPDGTVLALNLGYDGVLLWDVATGAEIVSLAGNMQANGAVAFSPDGALVAGSTTDYKVHLWNASDGSEANALTGHTGYVYDVAFSPDGATLASASYDKSIRLWNTGDGSEQANLVGTEADPLAQAYAVSFDPEGRLLASGHADGRIALWDPTTQTLQAVILSQADDVVDIAFSPDGALLATAGALHTAELWDVVSGSAVAATFGHTNYVSAVAFSPDSSTLAISDWDMNIWLWNTGLREELNLSPTVPDAGTTGLRNDRMMGYSPDGKVLVSTDGFDVLLFEAATGAPLGKLDGDGTLASIAFSPDSALAAVASSQGLYVFDLTTQGRLAFFASNDWLNEVTFSPDQTMIATAGKDHTARVYGLP